MSLVRLLLVTLAGAVVGAITAFGFAMLCCPSLVWQAVVILATLGAGVMATVALSERPNPKAQNRQDPSGIGDAEINKIES